jgi:DNA-binding transcriptional LysR family regulator
MNILHLRYAVEVEKTGSISQAAENLYMAQPNLSKAIKELENSLGITIFRRTSKGVVPTRNGTDLLDYAKNILEQIDEMESRYKNKDKGKQSFGISVPRSSYITNAFTSFIEKLDRSKEIGIDFSETNSMQAVHNVTERGHNLAIIRYQKIYEPYFLKFLRDRGFVREDIWEVEYSVLLSQEHTAAKKNPLYYADLKDGIEIAHGDLTVPNISHVDRQKAEESPARKRIIVYERGSQLDLLTRIPDTYMWATPMPEDILQRGGLLLKKREDVANVCKDVLVYPKKYKLGELDRAFLHEIYHIKEKLSL